MSHYLESSRGACRAQQAAERYLGIGHNLRLHLGYKTPSYAQQQ